MLDCKDPEKEMDENVISVKNWHWKALFISALLQDLKNWWRLLLLLILLNLYISVAQGLNIQKERNGLSLCASYNVG